MRCWVGLLTLAGLVQAAPADAQTNPCNSGAEITVASASLGYFTCERGMRVIVGVGTVYDLSPQGDDPAAAAAPAGKVTITLEKLEKFGYGRIVFNPPLVSGKNYLLSMQPAEILTVLQHNGLDVGSAFNPAAPAGNWNALHVKFSTKPTVLLFPASGDESHRFRIASPVALQTCTPPAQGSPHKPQIVESLQHRSETVHAAVLTRHSRLTPNESDSATADCQLAVIDPTTKQSVFDPVRIGSGEVSLRTGAFRQGVAKLNVTGVLNVFGEPVSVPEDKRKVTVGTVPKGKDDALYYLKFGQEATEGTGPAWTLDAKLAPVFNRDLAGFNPSLNITADVGFGTAESTNTITAGGGLTRLKLTGNQTVPAIRFTPVVNMEADRDFKEKLNLLLDSDVRFYMRWMNNGRAVRSRRLYVAALERKTPEEAAEIDPDAREFDRRLGWSGMASLAVEAGHVLRESTVETDDKSSSVTVPTHGIARLRAKLQATLEIDRFSFGVAVTPRYLLSTETVGHIGEVLDPATGKNQKVAELLTVEGEQTYLEVTVQFGLDRSGHIAITSTYKRGPTPPTFERVNVMQSGLTIKY